MYAIRSYYALCDVYVNDAFGTAHRAEATTHGIARFAPVAARLAELLGRDVPLVANWVDGVSVAPGQVVLLENCRVNPGEKKNDEGLARKMAALCDIFVHDAFGTAHRAEASTYGIAQFAPVACAGPLLAAEIDAISSYNFV